MSQATSTKTFVAKKRVQVLSLMLAVFLCWNADAVHAQFRFKSSFGQSSGRSQSPSRQITTRKPSSSQSNSKVQNRAKSSWQSKQKTNQITRQKTNSAKVGASKVGKNPKSTRENGTRTNQLLKYSNGKNSTAPAKAESPAKQERISKTKESRTPVKLSDRIKDRVSQNRGSNDSTSRTESDNLDSKTDNKSSSKLSDLIADRLSGRRDSEKRPKENEDSKDQTDRGEPSDADRGQDAIENNDNGNGNGKEDSKTPSDPSGRTPIDNGSIFDQIGNNGRLPGNNESDDSEPTPEADEPEDQPENPEQESAEDSDDVENSGTEQDTSEPDANDQTEEPSTEEPPAEEKDCKQTVREIIVNVLDRVSSNPAPIVIQLPAAEVAEPASPAARKIRTDLEVVDVKFVDFGNEADNIGPKFKISVRNHNSKFATESVEVVVIAAIDVKKESLGRTATAMTIDSIGPRVTSELEVQLSREAYELMTEEGTTAIFSELAVIVDPEKKFTDVRPANNVVIKAIDDIEMVNE